MKNSRLVEITKSLSAQDRRLFRKFLHSPVFNQRTDVILLQELLEHSIDTQRIPTKAQAHVLIYKKEVSDPQKIRLLMTYLLRLVEQFLALRVYLDDPTVQQLYLVQGLRNRHTEAAAYRAVNQALKKLEQQPMRNEHFWSAKAHLLWEQYSLQSRQNPLSNFRLPELSDAQDIAFIVSKLRLSCLAMAHHRVYSQAGFEARLLPVLLEFVEKEKLYDIPVIRIYFHCYWMLKDPAKEENFSAFKNALIQFGVQFPHSEIRDLYLLAINFCIRQVNDGHWDHQYFLEVLELYQEGLSAGYLIENGQLSRFTYYNAVVAALKVKKYEWAGSFIESYKNNLDKKHRESAYSINKARLEYARRNYDEAIHQLQSYNFRDTLLNLSARVMLIKIYYETDDWDLMQFQLDAMKNYLRRKRPVGYHRNLFKDFIRFSQQLIRSNLLDDDKRQQLIEAIRQSEHLTEKDWILEQLGKG